MKMIYCTYNVSVADEMVKIVDNLEVENYQIFNNVVAKTKGADPRFDTAVWPGYNNSILIQTKDDKEEGLLLEISRYNKITKDQNEKIIVFSWNIE